MTKENLQWWVVILQAVLCKLTKGGRHFDFFPLWRANMFPGIHPCFQLLRIGSSCSVNGSGGAVPDSAHDLYTFRPALAHSVFRLGRLAELCDVTLESTTVSRVHAELHAEKQTDAAGEESWKVQVRDRSSYGWC